LETWIGSGAGQKSGERVSGAMNGCEKLAGAGAKREWEVVERGAGVLK